MKTFMNRLLIIGLSPALIASILVRGIFKIATREIPSAFKDLWKNSTVQPKTIEQNKGEMMERINIGEVLKTKTGHYWDEEFKMFISNDEIPNSKGTITKEKYRVISADGYDILQEKMNGAFSEGWAISPVQPSFVGSYHCVLMERNIIVDNVTIS